ncbi:MAG TPA: Ig-like domain-containing protein [Mycobacteriales bacterium]|nr:Ig-like domain-containing protein [Mycobacteriales bacterium]
MSSWQKRPPRRWAAAAVVIGSVSAVLASPLALGTAFAAAQTVSGITVTTTSASAASGAGATATVSGTYTASADGTAPTNIEYTVTNGTDQSASGGHAAETTAPAGCTATRTSATGGTFSCTVVNKTGNPATDTVQVFGDNGNNTFDGSPTDVVGSPTATVHFTAPPTSVSFTTAPTTGTAGTCADYTATTNGVAAGDQPLNLIVTESSAANPGATPITLYPTGCANGGSTTTGNSVTGTGPYNNTFTHTVTTDASGSVTFGIMTSAAGTGTVKLDVPSNTSVATSAVNVTWNSGGADSITSVTPAPGSTSQLTGTTASFNVTVANNGSPVQGVTVMEETTTGPDTIAPTSCGTSNASGQVTCTVHNGGTAGADALTFWVDNSSGSCSHTTGPDSCEPKGTATATFTAAPAVSSANSTLTCVQQLAGANKGTAQTDCTVPTSQTSVTFTATVKDASGNPISGAPVTFTATAAKLGGTTLSGSNLPASATTNTNSSGVATYTVSDPTPAGGDNASVSAAVGATSVGSATAHWAAPAATGLTVAPALQTVTKGGTVTVKATVTDQFGTAVSGTHVITYIVSGRNNAKTGTAAPDGTISYTDAGSSPAVMTDTISVTDVTDSFNGTANVAYVTGSTTASTVTVDTSGLGVSDGTCGASGHTAATGVALQHVTEVCAVVVNNTTPTPEPLAGKTVTFTVSNGQVDAHGSLSSTSTTTYTATTDANGVAFADVTSAKSGAQTVTAAADAATGSGTITYSAPAATAAYSIALAPTNPTVAPGGSQKFTATVTDKFGNPVSGVSVNFTQSGPGSISGASSATVTTGPDGTAAVTVTTQSTDTGAGSVTATIGTAGTQCNSAPTGTPPSACTANATYSVAATIAPSSLTLSSVTKLKVQHHLVITATATNSDDTRAANQVVRVYLTGANTAAAAGTTDSNGVAHIRFLVTHHGTDHVAAFVDTNRDQIREANEPRAFRTVRVQGIEHPSISLSSHHGRVTVHVTTHPKAYQAEVRYYVQRHGHWHLIGHNRTAGITGKGKAHHSFSEPRGSHRTFRVKVSETSTSTAGTSPEGSIHVK